MTEQVTEGKSSMDETTGTWKVAAPISEDRDETPKLVSVFSSRSVVKGIRLTSVADSLGVVPSEPAVVSLVVSSKGPGEEEFTEVEMEETGRAVSCLMFLVGWI